MKVYHLFILIAVIMTTSILPGCENHKKDDGKLYYQLKNGMEGRVSNFAKSEIDSTRKYGVVSTTVSTFHDSDVYGGIYTIDIFTDSTQQRIVRLYSNVTDRKDEFMGVEARIKVYRCYKVAIQDTCTMIHEEILPFYYSWDEKHKPKIVSYEDWTYLYQSTCLEFSKN